MEGRVSGKLIVPFSIFVVGASRFEGCEISVAVVLDTGCEHEGSEGDEGPYRWCLDGKVDERELVVSECGYSFDPYGNAEADIESHAQDPMADPHGAFRGAREGFAFVQASNALCKDGKPDDEDLMEGHRGTGGADISSDVRRDGPRESIVGRPKERAGDGGDVKRGEPAVRHLECCCVVQGGLDKVLGLCSSRFIWLDRRGCRASAGTIGKETRAQGWEKKDKLDLPFLSA